MNLNTKYSANITNYNTIKAGGTLTMTARNVKNGGYRCGSWVSHLVVLVLFQLINWYSILIMTIVMKWVDACSLNMQK